MSRITPTLLCLTCLVLLGSTCPGTPSIPGTTLPAPVGAQSLFDELWLKFDEKYSYFTYKDIDWDDVLVRYRSEFAADLTPDEFVDKLLPMLGELHDWHVDVQRANGTWESTTPETYEKNYPETPRNKYLKAGEVYHALGNNTVRHAWFQNNIAYIRVDSFTGDAFANISDADIENIFATYQTADGIIFDIRPNNGGDETIAAKFTSHFTDLTQLYGYTETRNGPGHDDFDPLEDHELSPSNGTLFLGEAVCLIGPRCMSSAEWCTLMMRACPNVMLIGDTTRGASGDPEVFGLSNGVNYKLSRWIAYTDFFFEIEDVGIDPDIFVAPPGFDANGDYVIEEAIQQLTT
ncbi:MAG: S41 family peptidase [Planctomycetota bacterium]